MRVCIVGLGLIGGSIARDIRETQFATEIVGVDASVDNGNRAIELGIVDRVESLESGVSDVDLVVIATPVDAIVRVLPIVLNSISAHTTVTDVGSTKRVICKSVDQHPNRQNYVPSHPMSGTENSGPDAAIKGLFKGKITIICDQERSRPQHVAIVEKMYQSMGMSVAYMSSDEQDHSTAYVSHLPHATAFALANAVLDNEDREIIFDLASGGFRSAVRLAKSTRKMWAPIFEQNRDYMIESLDVYVKHLNNFKEALKSEDSETLYNLIDSANNIREVLNNSTPSLTKSEETIVKFYTQDR